MEDSIRLFRELGYIVLTSGDSRDDADLVAILDGRLSVAKEANIFVIEEDVYETANVAAFVADALGESGIGLFQIVENVTDGGTLRGNDFVFSGQFPERCWDANGSWHDKVGRD